MSDPKSETADLIERLRAPANWLRQDKGQTWKAGVSQYDRAPFEAADEIERLRSAVGSSPGTADRVATGKDTRVKIWFDTEFIEDGKTIDLISIGMVREDGAEFYAVSSDCNLDRASTWVRENVVPHLKGGPVMSRQHIVGNVLAFAGDRPEFWGFYADYDWVVLCQLFGTMMDLPKGWPMYCRDLKQLCDSVGNPNLPEQGKGEHHALADARWNKQAYEFLQKRMESPRGRTQR